jgi:hypothetical protein
MRATVSRAARMHASIDAPRTWKGSLHAYYRGAHVVREAGYTNVNTETVQVVLPSDDAEFLASRIADDVRCNW